MSRAARRASTAASACNVLQHLTGNVIWHNFKISLYKKQAPNDPKVAIQ